MIVKKPPGFTRSEVAIIVRWAAGHARFHKVYLFGSRAKGGHRSDSDVDLAVILTEDERDGSLGHWICQAPIYRAGLIGKLPMPVDLQLATGDDEVVMPAVREHGWLLYSSAPERT